jgi:hypothetical protein
MILYDRDKKEFDNLNIIPLNVKILKIFNLITQTRMFTASDLLCTNPTFVSRLFSLLCVCTPFDKFFLSFILEWFVEWNRI